jgi:beta-lactam-binding protein with PASTA domain/predicted Ser/Thr protein kinase
MPELAPNTLIDGRYRLVSRLGSGGMADVFLVEDQQLGRKVALKLLYRRFAEDPDFVERFRREAQAAAGLQHPNVVGVYDRGSFDDTYYIAMEYLPGQTLKQLIRREAPLDPVRAIDLTLQILRAARFAHRRGVIHRDLKPHNVIVDDSDHAKVTDFGIARAGASDMTETGSIMGTAQYLSPEQAQGHVVSEHSDLYSIGIVLYEMLTGKVPFDAEAAVTIALKHVSESPAPPSTINPNIPPELEQVVLWTLNKDPADRPGSADQLINALEQCKAAILSGSAGQHTASMAALAVADAAGAPFVPVPIPPAPAYQDQPTNGEAVLVEEVVRPRRRPPVWVWALLAVLLIAAAALGAYLIAKPVKKVVPPVTGETLNVARTQLQNAGFSVGIINVTDRSVSGTVIGEDPQANSKADDGSTVTLTVSQGPGNGTVPSVQGFREARAKRLIAAAHLKVDRTLPESSNQFAAGFVTRTDPTAGESLPIGTGVTLFVSSGKAKVTVPDVRGEPQAAATQALTNLSLKSTTSMQPSSTDTPGTVISQSPVGGSSEPQGATVSLVIASAPTTASVPSVQGQTATAAAGALTSAGFKVSRTSQTVTNPARNGIVLSQSPRGGGMAKKGSTVRIIVGQFTSPTTSTPTTTTPTTTSTTTTPTTTSTTTPAK